MRAAKSAKDKQNIAIIRLVAVSLSPVILCQAFKEGRVGFSPKRLDFRVID